MAFFAYPYLVTFDDSMAYGSHHFLTNFRFQCATREALLFRKIIDGQHDWHDEFAKVVLLTRDGYSRNMNAVDVGETVVVFMSLEDPTLSSIRLCFRVASNQGKPVACGFQSVVCVDRSGNSVVEPPKALTQFAMILQERPGTPNFKDRALAGGSLATTLFEPALLETARRLGNAPVAEAYPQIIDVDRPGLELPSLALHE